ncbi:MAG: formate dehydrogenase subunit delta [Hyphomicrobiales bacterium]|nr:formate dehydrogenase subunit delta [Hyphomicrobiales bacterium]
MNESKGPEANLVRMANQMADYFKAFPESEAAPGVADHIRKFWTPKMRAEFIKFGEAHPAHLHALAREALVLLKQAATK